MRIDSRHATALDTLRLNRSQQHELQQQLLRRKRQQINTEARREPRFEYDPTQGMIIEVFHPGGTNSNYLVKPRNLSSHGIGFLHGSFLHSGTECHVWVRTTAGSLVCVTGAVARCQWITGRVHEIGVKFDEPITLEDFLTPSTHLTDNAPLSTELPTIEGRLTYVCDDPKATESIAPLAGMGLHTRVVGTVQQTIDQLTEQAPDVLLIDMVGGPDANTEAISALRATGFTGPILAMCAPDEEAEVTAAWRRAGANAMIFRPLTYDNFIIALQLPEAELTLPSLESDDPVDADAPTKTEAPAPVDTARVHGVLQAMLKKMRDYVKKMWEQFTHLLG